MLGFVVIVILYAVIGLMAAGTIFIARKMLAPKAEQIFYAMFRIMIVAFYHSRHRITHGNACREIGHAERIIRARKPLTLSLAERRPPLPPLGAASLQP